MEEREGEEFSFWAAKCKKIATKLGIVQAHECSLIHTRANTGTRTHAFPSAHSPQHAHTHTHTHSLSLSSFLSFPFRSVPVHYAAFGIGVFTAGSHLFLNGVVLGVVYYGGMLMSRSELTAGDLMRFLVSTQTIQRALSNTSVLFGQVCVCVCVSVCLCVCVYMCVYFLPFALLCFEMPL